jgi:hypothetical protein
MSLRAFVLAAGALAACQPATPAPVPTVPPPPALAAEGPPRSAARAWIEPGARTLRGPTWGDETVVLLGGRRALLSREGKLRFAEGPEPAYLVDVVVVPSVNGPRWVGYDGEVVYRFDDPLGPGVPLVRIDAPENDALYGVGSAPGVVVVFPTLRLDGDRDLPTGVLPQILAEPADPVYVDVVSGARTAGPPLPVPPLGMAFADSARGAAVLAAGGLVVTTDGGASWRRVSDGGRGDAGGMTWVRARDGVLWAGRASRDHRDPRGPERRIDVATATLAPVGLPREEQPLLRSLGVGVDPMRLAASDSAPAADGTVVILARGLLSRVDPATQSVLATVEAPGACARGSVLDIVGGAGLAWFACWDIHGSGVEIYSTPTASLAPGRLQITVPYENREYGHPYLVAGPGGGVMVSAPCTCDAPGTGVHGCATDPSSTPGRCVRQPDGRWITLRVPPADGVLTSAGPLADGRLAFARVPAPPVEAAAPQVARVAIVAATGEPIDLPPVPVGPGPLRVLGGVEETADHQLLSVLVSGQGQDRHAYLARQPLDGRKGAVEEIPGARQVVLGDGRGVAITRGGALIWPGGTAPWTPLPLPPRLASSLAKVVADVAPLHVTRAGFTIGDFTHLGWRADPYVPFVAPVEGRSPPLVSTTTPRPDPRRAPVRCAARNVTPAARGWDRHGREAGLGILLERDDPPTRAPKGQTTVRYVDLSEIGGAARTLSLPFPWVDVLAASGAAAMGRSDRRELWLRGPRGVDRASGEGATDIVFGARGEVVAFRRGSEIFAWRSGEAPRGIARLSREAVLIGRPTRDGVPLLLWSGTTSRWRTIPIPAAPAPGARRDESQEAATPLLPIDGWTLVDGLTSPSALPTCAALWKGPRFVVPDGLLAVAGGAEWRGRSREVWYDVDVAGSSACVAGVRAVLDQAGPDLLTDPEERVLPLSYLRADFVARRADGAGFGEPASQVRALDCERPPPP